MKNLVAIAFTLLTLTTSMARADQKLVPAQSQIDFTSKQMGVPVNGSFR